MKVKLNLNVGAAKQLLIQHGEKAGFGLAALVLLLFLWKTVTFEVLPATQQPDPLKQLAASAEQHIRTSPWDPKAKHIEVVDYPARAEQHPLQAANYPLVTNIDKPLFEAHGKRPGPKLLPIEGLVAASGQCFMLLKETAPKDGGEAKASDKKEALPRGAYYAAVTGLIPLRKQSVTYDDAFRNAAGYSSTADRPTYVGLKIERAEINPANPKLDWQNLDLASVNKFMMQWAGTDKNDIVDKQYIDPTLTMPLPALLGKSWDPAVAGHDGIPLAEEKNSGKPADQAAPEAAPETTEEGFGGFGSAPSTKKPQPAGGSAQTRTNSATTAAAGGAKVDQKLFRFVDYKVEPGKQYRYRVKVALANPNFGKPDRELENSALAQAKILETAWSEPTADVMVPRGVSILAGPIVKPVDKPVHDPDVLICVITFDPARGGEPAVKKQVQRGVLANFLENTLWVLTPASKTPSKWEKVDVRSNALVVDVQGGRRLGTKKDSLVEPIELLMLDADGKLSVHDELDDVDEYHSRLDPLDSPKESSDSKPKAAATEDDSNPYATIKPKAGAPKRARGAPASATPKP